MLNRWESGKWKKEHVHDTEKNDEHLGLRYERLVSETILFWFWWGKFGSEGEILSEKHHLQVSNN